MGTVFLRRLSRWQAETERYEIADLYVEAMEEAPGARVLRRDGFLQRFADHDLQQPGFDMVVASDPALAGSAHGFRVDRGAPWWESFPEVPTGLRAPGLMPRQIYLVAGLLVAPRQRRRQVATRMLTELLARSGAAMALTLLDPGNAPARAAFQSWGWAKAGQLTVPGGGPPPEAWARRLGGV